MLQQLFIFFTELLLILQQQFWHLLNILWLIHKRQRYSNHDFPNISIYLSCKYLLCLGRQYCWSSEHREIVLIWIHNNYKDTMLRANKPNFYLVLSKHNNDNTEGI